MRGICNEASITRQARRARRAAPDQGRATKEAPTHGLEATRLFALAVGGLLVATDVPVLLLAIHVVVVVGGGGGGRGAGVIPLRIRMPLATAGRMSARLLVRRHLLHLLGFVLLPLLPARVRRALGVFPVAAGGSLRVSGGGGVVAVCRGSGRTGSAARVGEVTTSSPTSGTPSSS